MTYRGKFKKMINWIIIIVLMVVAFIAVKYIHIRHRILVVLILLLGLFVFIGITSLSDQTDFSTTQGAVSSLKTYGGWLGNVYSNLKSVIGEVIKLDWVGGNNTRFESG